MNKYEIIAQIGRGSFGTVYKCRLRHTGQFAALKIIPMSGKSKSDLDQLQKEIHMLRTISHPNVIQFYDFFEENNNYNIVTELAQTDLFDILQNNPIPLHNLQKIAFYVLNILQHLHDSRIAHRDVKPQNVLVCDGGVCKICDFGFARQMGAQTFEMSSIKGSPIYLAPEIAKGQSYTEMTDVWSFGVMMFELATQKPPFLAGDYIQLIKVLQQESLKADYAKYQVFQENPIFEDFLQQCLKRNPDKRPSAKKLLEHPFLNPEKNDLFMLVKSGLQNNQEKDWFQIKESGVESCENQQKGELTEKEDQIENYEEVENQFEDQKEDVLYIPETAKQAVREKPKPQIEEVKCEKQVEIQQVLQNDKIESILDKINFQNKIFNNVLPVDVEKQYKTNQIEYLYVIFFQLINQYSANYANIASYLQQNNIEQNIVAGFNKSLNMSLNSKITFLSQLLIIESLKVNKSENIVSYLFQQLNNNFNKQFEGQQQLNNLFLQIKKYGNDQNGSQLLTASNSILLQVFKELINILRIINIIMLNDFSYQQPSAFGDQPQYPFDFCVISDNQKFNLIRGSLHFMLIQNNVSTEKLLIQIVDLLCSLCVNTTQCFHLLSDDNKLSVFQAIYLMQDIISAMCSFSKNTTTMHPIFGDLHSQNIPDCIISSQQQEIDQFNEVMKQQILRISDTLYMLILRFYNAQKTEKCNNLTDSLHDAFEIILTEIINNLYVTKRTTHVNLLQYVYDQQTQLYGTKYQGNSIFTLIVKFKQLQLYNILFDINHNVVTDQTNNLFNINRNDNFFQQLMNYQNSLSCSQDGKEDSQFIDYFQHTQQNIPQIVSLNNILKKYKITDFQKLCDVDIENDSIQCYNYDVCKYIYRLKQYFYIVSSLQPFIVLRTKSVKSSSSDDILDKYIGQINISSLQVLSQAFCFNITNNQQHFENKNAIEIIKNDSQLQPQFQQFVDAVKQKSSQNNKLNARNNLILPHSQLVQQFTKGNLQFNSVLTHFKINSLNHQHIYNFATQFLFFQFESGMQWLLRETINYCFTNDIIDFDKTTKQILQYINIKNQQTNNSGVCSQFDQIVNQNQTKQIVQRRIQILQLLNLIIKNNVQLSNIIAKQSFYIIIPQKQSKVQYKIHYISCLLLVFQFYQLNTFEYNLQIQLINNILINDYATNYKLIQQDNDKVLQLFHTNNTLPQNQKRYLTVSQDQTIILNIFIEKLKQIRYYQQSYGKIQYKWNGNWVTTKDDCILVQTQTGTSIQFISNQQNKKELTSNDYEILYNQFNNTVMVYNILLKNKYVNNEMFIQEFLTNNIDIIMCYMCNLQKGNKQVEIAPIYQQNQKLTILDQIIQLINMFNPSIQLINKITTYLLFMFDQQYERQIQACYKSRHNDSMQIECCIEGCINCLMSMNGLGSNVVQGVEIQQLHMKFKQMASVYGLCGFIEIIQKVIQEERLDSLNLQEVVSLLVLTLSDEFIERQMIMVSQNLVEQYIIAVLAIIYKIGQTTSNLSLFIASCIEFNFVKYLLNMLKYCNTQSAISLIYSQLSYLASLESPLHIVFVHQMVQHGIISNQLMNKIIQKSTLLSKVSYIQFILQTLAKIIETSKIYYTQFQQLISSETLEILVRIDNDANLLAVIQLATALFKYDSICYVKCSVVVEVAIQKLKQQLNKELIGFIINLLYNALLHSDLYVDIVLTQLNLIQNIFINSTQLNIKCGILKIYQVLYHHKRSNQLLNNQEEFVIQQNLIQSIMQNQCDSGELYTTPFKLVLQQLMELQFFNNQQQQVIIKYLGKKR